MITKCPYLCGPDVLFHPDCTTKSIKLDYSSATDGVIKGGSPINAAGRVANDATAIGVLRRDCYEGYHPRGQVIIGGYVDQDKAQENSGIVLAGAAKAAMVKVLFVNASGVPQLGAPEGYPKKTSIEITWDGDTTDRPSAAGAYYYIGTHEEVYNASGTIKVSKSENGVVSDEELAEKDIEKSNSGFVAYSDYAIYCYDASETFYGVSFPCTGLFFANTGEQFLSKLEITDITPMAEEFMPVLTSPNGTKYKLAVDDTGTLSATEVT